MLEITNNDIKRLIIIVVHNKQLKIGKIFQKTQIKLLDAKNTSGMKIHWMGLTAY